MIEIALLIALAGMAADPDAAFAEMKIDEEFVPYLTSNPLLMELSGTKIIRLPKGRHVIISVASTPIKDNTAQDRLRAEKVCRLKALTGILSEKQGVQIAHTETLNDKTIVVLDGKRETGTSISELLQVTKSTVEGVVKDIPVVGRWKSKDGQVFYLALGAILEPGDDDAKAE